MISNKSYDPKTVESSIQSLWDTFHLTTAHPLSPKKKYTIIQPPPNITGILHMGHALSSTLEDILIRKHRMDGYEVLFLPGLDHAGIATQMMVEKKIAREEKKSRHDIGRKAFIEKVFEWKEEHSKKILEQEKKLGLFLDMSRLRFTLDTHASIAVREAFVRLYEEGIIYRDKGLIKWCPRCRTSLSDLEVNYISEQTTLYYITYTEALNTTNTLTVATVRPETIVGDMALCIHPDDDRYQSLTKDKEQKHYTIPILSRPLPLLFDRRVDKDFGTGVLKITPSHDPLDYDIAKTYGLPLLDIFADDGTIHLGSSPYHGLKAKEAREKIIEDLTSFGRVQQAEPHVHKLSVCSRCEQPIEPKVRTEWFINTSEMALQAKKLVKEKKIIILPSEWEKTYLHWMENIKPWCISRQLWWGHQIPVWYCRSCQSTIASRVDLLECAQCKSADIYQDTDVLDTWFSSGLWPFSTLGWPDEKNPDYQNFYPTSVLETGFDIIFFWVARMIMLGVKLTGQSPFHTVYLHPMVRDEKGLKMSKTKGNVIDPLHITETKGADALRFTLVSLAVHGRDVLLSETRIDGYKNFINKLWNAFRFIEIHFQALTDVSTPRMEDPINQWMENRFEKTRKDLNEALRDYRFFEASDILYHFIWNEICDWYLEFIKLDIEERVQKNDAYPLILFEKTLRLLHPFTPFITEFLWQKIVVTLNIKKQGKSIIDETTPPPLSEENISRYQDAYAEIESIKNIISQIRTSVSEHQLKVQKNNTTNSTSANIIYITGEDKLCATLKKYFIYIQKLTKYAWVSLNTPSTPLEGYTHITLATLYGDAKISVPHVSTETTQTTYKKLEKELEALTLLLAQTTKQLSIPTFLSQAPPKVVEEFREKKIFLEKKIASIQETLSFKKK